jgi:hypothetical protein
VPFDVAFSLTQRERLAWVVVMGTLHGRVFDWSTETWVEET